VIQALHGIEGKYLLVRFQAQAISYTTGVPAMIGAMLVMNGEWRKPGVWNVEDFNPDPFMDALNKWGLPWQESHNPELLDLDLDAKELSR